jgi:hypothetical protein
LGFEEGIGIIAPFSGVGWLLRRRHLEWSLAQLIASAEYTVGGWWVGVR